MSISISAFPGLYFQKNNLKGFYAQFRQREAEETWSVPWGVGQKPPTGGGGVAGSALLRG